MIDFASVTFYLHFQRESPGSFQMCFLLCSQVKWLGSRNWRYQTPELLPIVSSYSICNPNRDDLFPSRITHLSKNTNIYNGAISNQYIYKDRQYKKKEAFKNVGSICCASETWQAVTLSSESFNLMRSLTNHA